MFVVSVRERGKEEHKFTFRKPKISIGRLRANDIILPKRNVSKKHAELEVGPGDAVVLVDMGSTNGTFLNGKRVQDRVELSPTDKLFVGDYLIQVEIVADKSAIEGAPVGPTPITAPKVPSDEQRSPASTADLDSDLLEAEMKRLGLSPADTTSGPATVVVSRQPEGAGAFEVEAPVQGGEEDLAEPIDLDSHRPAAPAAEASERPTLKVPLVEPSPPGEPEEEDLLDIPLMEEDQAEVAATPEAEVEAPQAPKKPAVRSPSASPFETQPPATARVEPRIPPQKPVSAPHYVQPHAAQTAAVPPTAVPPPPEPVPATQELAAQPVLSSTQQVRFLVPSDSANKTLSDALNAAWPRIEAAFEGYIQRSKAALSDTRAADAVCPVVAEAVSGHAAGPALQDLCRQIVSELTGLGGVAALLESPKVGEVFVNSSGRIVAYDWRGNLVDTNASLSCSYSVARMAQRLSAEVSRAPAGLMQTRLADGTVVRIVNSPLAAVGAGIRFVRPFRADLSLSKLRDTGLAGEEHVARLRAAVAGGRSVLVLGRETETNGIVVAATAAAVPPDRKVLGVGDRFAGLSSDRRWLLLDVDVVTQALLLQACASLDCHWIVIDNAAPEAALAALKAAAACQVPFIMSVRSANPGAYPAVASAAGGSASVELLALAAPLVVTTRRAEDGLGRVDGTFQFAKQADGSLKLGPFAP